jgi:Entner-Doudoroff aldolase
MTILEQLSETKIVPVVVLDDAKDAAPLAKAMIAGGLPVAEVTFRTAAAADAIRTMAKIDSMLVGAGTVLTVEQVNQAKECGAQFIVSPGTNLDVVRRSLELGLTVIPGAVTPTEIQTLLAEGISTVKFFPANVYGGAKAIKSLSAPFGGVSFVPTGGISASNVKEYLDLPSIPAVGGSWMVPKNEISAGNFDEITRLCAEAIAATR